MSRGGFGLVGSPAPVLLYHPADLVQNNPASGTTALALTGGMAFRIQSDLAVVGARVSWAAAAGTPTLTCVQYDPAGVVIDTPTAVLDTTKHLYTLAFADPIRLWDYGDGVFVIAAYDSSAANYFSLIAAALPPPYVAGDGVESLGPIYSLGAGVYPATYTAVETYGVEPQFVRL